MASEAGGGPQSDTRSLHAATGLLAVALEGMEDGAVDAGLPLNTARAFVRQTVLTAAMLLENSDASPAELKDQVASPAGTTIAGLAVLEDHAVRGAFIRAMETACAPGRVPEARVSRPIENSD